VTLPADQYRQWRDQGGAALAFREVRRQRGPPERWLQEIWAHQRIRRDNLRTVDGRHLVVLHPGFWNRESGPDFRQAIVRFGDDPPRSGDIEIDLVSSGWRTHGHLLNPDYEQVILHVVWSAPESPTPLPTLVLEPCLDAPLAELETWVGGAGDMPSRWLEGHCSAPLRRLSPDSLEDILKQAALVRLQTKGLLVRARARVAGWHQSLREGVFRALGYKHNAWPMQRLAEILAGADRLQVDSPDARELWEARLLGLSGLLPAEPRSGTYARRLWDAWWRERGAFDSQILPANIWRLNGVRPVNHPQRRLALAASWAADPSWTQRLEDWFRAGLTGPGAERALGEAFPSEVHGYWLRHYTLQAKAAEKALPVLGSGRVTDLAVNAVLPWFWARAEAGGDSTAVDYIRRLYLEWPAGEENATVRLARARLLGGDRLPIRCTASIQQGLLQIVRDFCGYSNALCERCRFPALIDEHGGGRPGEDGAKV
jgi:hypothetical protein